MPELADIPGVVVAPLLITTGRWFNKLRPSGKVAKAPAYKTGFSYDEFAYGEDKAEQFQPDGVPLYDSIICAPSTRVLAIDVDYPEALPFSRLGHVLPGARQRAISTRGDHFHVILDMRGIDPADWPQQGRTAWGDIKAAGFIPMPGSCHYSGVQYAPVMADYPQGAATREEWLAAATASVSRQAVVADAELVTALKADRVAHARDRLVQATQDGMNPRAIGVRDVSGAWVYASGYVQGSWAQLPDGFLCHDDELKDLAWDMGLRGIDHDTVQSEWRRLAGTLDSSDPWTDKDFERHWRHVPGVHAELVERAEQDAIGWDRLDPDSSLRNAALDRARRRIDARQPVNNPSGFDEYFAPGQELLAPIPLFASEAGVSVRRAYNDAFIGWEPFDPKGATDSAHAWAVLERTFSIARYDPDADVWLSRDLDRWMLCTGDIMRGLVTDVIDSPAPGEPARMPYGMTKEEATANEHGYPEDVVKAERRRHENWLKFHSTSGIGAIAGYASALLRSGKRHPSHVSICTLDNDPAELWAGGECWDLRASGEQPVRKVFPKDQHGNEHKPIHLKSAACAPWHVPPEDEERLLPLWTELTTAIWPDDDVREWALLCLAAGLTGDPKKAIPVLQGGSDRGKSTIAMALLSVLGSYGNVVNPKIVDGDTNSHDTIFMELMGCRFAFIDEGPKAGRAATNRLKRLAGGARITANRMRKDPVTFDPTHTLCIALNPEERLPLDDQAILSRVRFIPCDGDPGDVIAAARKLDYFKSVQWRREMPGVLAVMMRYAARILNDPAALDKDNAPEAVQRAERTEVEDQDDVLRWFDEATTECPAGYPSRELYVAFRKWTEETRGMKGFVISEKKWALRMDELIPEDRKDAPNALPRRTGRLRRRQPGPASWLAAGRAEEPPPSSPPPEPPAPGPQALPDAQELRDAPVFEPHPELEPQAATALKKPSRSRLTEEEKAARAAAKEAERLAKAAQREEEKLARQLARREELARQKEEARLAKIASLSGPLLPLPALVVRGEPGTEPQVLPCTPEQALVMIEQYLDALCVDCETSGFPAGHKFYELRTIQLGQAAMSAVFDAADPAQAAVAASLLQRARRLHAHSATADIVPCVIAGLITWEAAWAKMDDSVLIAKLSDPRLTGSDANGLKDLARDVLGEQATSPPADKARGELFTALGALTETEITTPYERSGWAQVDKHATTMIRYAGSDVLDLGGVIARLPAPDPARMERERAFQGQCARVAKDGFLLDHPHIIAKIAEFTQKQEEARQRVFEASGGAIDNPSSPVVGEYLASQGYQLESSAKTGRPSAAKAQLEPFAQVGDQLCKDILEYRHCVTTRGLLLEPLNALCVHGDGRMRPTVYTINADTGRTSCVRPNGQQFSRQGGIRACVIADPGMIGISADFSGVEIRVAAALSGDTGLLNAELSTRCLACEHDPCRPECGRKQTGMHWRVARMAWGPDATKENRYVAKRQVFAKLFGGSPRAGAKQTGTTLEVAQLVHRSFDDLAPVYAGWDRYLRSAYKEGTHVWKDPASGQTMGAQLGSGNQGIYRAYSGRDIYINAAHAFGNYAIQGTARELLVDGALRWGQTRWGHLPMLPIHDEILVFVPEAEAEEAAATLRGCMQSSLYGVEIAVSTDKPFRSWPDSS